MKTIKSVTIVPEFVRFIPDELQENVLYISEEFKTAVHLCLCGCKNKTVTPLGGKSNWEIVKGNGTVKKNLAHYPDGTLFQPVCRTHIKWI